MTHSMSTLLYAAVLVAVCSFTTARDFDRESVEQLLGIPEDSSAPSPHQISAPPETAQLPVSVLSFCRRAAPECYFRRSTSQQQAPSPASPAPAPKARKPKQVERAAVAPHDSSAPPAFPMRSRSAARQSFLRRLKARLSTLEGDLKDVRSQGSVGRRLLEFSTRVPDEGLPFPSHFYKVFGGLSQLEAASSQVLSHVEARICTVYDRFCSSLSQTALDMGQAAEAQPSHAAEDDGGREGARVWGGAAEEEGRGVAGTPEHLNVEGEELRPAQRAGRRPALTKAEIEKEIEMMEEGRWGERLEKGKVVSAARTEKRDPAEEEARKEEAELERERKLRAQKRQREEAKLKKEEAEERKARRAVEEKEAAREAREARERREHTQRLMDREREEEARDRPHHFNLHEPAVPHPEEDRERAAKQSRGRGAQAQEHAAGAGAGARREEGGEVDRSARVEGLCKIAQPACNGDTADGRRGLQFPQALYAHFGIRGDPRAVPLQQRARVEVNICEAANCLCSGVGCEEGKRKASGAMLNGADGGSGEEEGMTPEQMEEWWYNYTIRYNPGEPGRPGFHPGTEFPPPHPVQYEDGRWEVDPETGVGPKACIFMYAGIDCGRGVVEGANDALANATWQMEPQGSRMIKKLYSFHPTQVRNVLWDDDESNPIHKILYFVIPSLHDYPTLPHTTKIDIREWVWKGRTVLFLGGVINIYVMNEIFGFHLEPQYQPGPYEWNERYCPGTPFEDVPRKVFEQGNSRAGMTGVLIASIPPEGKTFFDTNGASVAMCIHVGFGRACYVDQEFIRPMSDYGYGVWVEIVRAALNGGRCDCICDDAEYGDAPGEFEPGEVTYSGEIYGGGGKQTGGASKLAGGAEGKDEHKCRCT